MGKGLNYSRLTEQGFPFDKEFEPLRLRKSFPIDKEDSSCSFTCKCGAVIIADPRALPEQCSECDAQNSFMCTDAYNELMRIPEFS